MVTKLGQKNPRCKFMMMMTFMEVKGHQRSKVVNYVLWLPNLVRRSLMQVYGDDDLHGGQRSSEVKGSKLCAMVTKLGQKNPWCKFKMMMTFMEVKGHMGSNIANYVPWLPNLVRWSVMTMMTCTEVKYVNLCYMATTFGQIYHSYKVRIMMTFIIQRSSEVR